MFWYCPFPYILQSEHYIWKLHLSGKEYQFISVQTYIAVCSLVSFAEVI